MAKDPAVLFYYQDFLVGTAFLTNEQVGAYQRILCHLFDKGTLPETDMMKICLTSECWNAIKDKFVLDKNGELYNVRSREEKQKRVSFTESRANNRKNKVFVPGSETDMNKTSIRYVEDMEDENEDEDLNDLNSNKGVDKFVRSLFIRTWGWNPPTKYLMGVCIELYKTYGAEMLTEAAQISSEYGKRSNTKYLKGVCEGLTKKNLISTIKDREKQAAAIKAEEKRVAWDPETSQIFKDIFNKFETKSEVMEKPSNKTQQIRNREFQDAVEKGVIK